MKRKLLTLLCGLSLAATSFAAEPELKETDKTMPKAKIIWASTTQLTLPGKPTELDMEKNPTVREHNRMAAKLMAELNIPVNDFYGLLINKLELGRGDTVHWTPPAHQILADVATASILKALEQKVVAKKQTAGRSGGGHVPWGALMFADLPKAKSESK